jgi:hypothetical protein
VPYSPIPVAERSKAWLFSRPLTGIAGSNPAVDMDGCLSLVNVGCCHVEISAQIRSLVRRSSTECGVIPSVMCLSVMCLSMRCLSDVSECDVSECDRDASIMRRPWPAGGFCAMEKKYRLFINDPVSSAGCVGSNSMANWNLT